jgi:hypothetical protein
MDRSGWQELINNLRGTKYPYCQDAAGYLIVHHVDFDSGLTDAEVSAVECRCDFQYPPDLRKFLQTALPCGPASPTGEVATKYAPRGWLDTTAVAPSTTPAGSSHSKRITVLRW